MRTNEEMLAEIESDDFAPTVGIDGDLLRAIGDAVDARDASQRLVDRLVSQAREVGVTWEQVARALHVSRQAAAKRYRTAA